jgi:ATP-dependent protease ClpP protease subunit
MGRIFIGDNIKDNDGKNTNTEDIVSKNTVLKHEDINIYEEIKKLSMNNHIQMKLSTVKINNEKNLFRREALWFNE